MSDFPTNARWEIFHDIIAERLRQDKKFPDQSATNIYEWVAILTEEVGEVAKAALEGDHANFREELIQVAAVAMKIVERMTREEE